MGNAAPITGPKQTVCIVGGGIGGMSVLQAMRKSKAGDFFDFVLVERKSKFHHNIGALRGVAFDSFIDQTWADYKRAEKNLGASLRRVHGTATAITDKVVTVQPAEAGAEPVEVKFDYLVIATGSQVPFPAKDTRTNSDDTIAIMHKIAAAAAEAENIVIVGGGAVGIELTGELAFYQPKKKLTLIHSGKSLLSRSIAAGLKPKVGEMCVTKLRAMGVNVVLGERVNRDALQGAPAPATAGADAAPAAAAAAGGAGGGAGAAAAAGGADGAAAVPADDGAWGSPGSRPTVIKGPVEVTTTGGTKVTADLVFMATGNSTNSAAYSGHFGSVTDEGTNRLQVNEYLQVKGYTNIFALGDCCNTKEEKLLYLASMHGAKVAKNIIALRRAEATEKEAKLSAYKPAKPMMFVTIGPKDGAAQLPNGMIAGKRMVPMAKGKTLFLGKVLKDALGPQ